MDKSSLRRDLRAQRRAVSVQQARTAAQRLLRLAQRQHLLRFRRIGFYLPMREEIDLIPLLNAALSGVNTARRCVPAAFSAHRLLSADA